MSRSIKKGPYVDPKLLKKIGKTRKEDKIVIRTWSRSSTVIPKMVGFIFGVHNGKEHIIVKPTEEMVGHKLGEFAPTTKFVRHGGKMQRDMERKKSSVPTAAKGQEKKNK